MKRLLFSIALVFFLSGCCYFSKRSCFPPCPPPEAVIITKRCELPKEVVMEGIETADEGCPEDMLCFDSVNYRKLGKRLFDMRIWIEDVKVRCGLLEVNKQDSGPGVSASDAGVRLD